MSHACSKIEGKHLQVRDREQRPKHYHDGIDVCIRNQGNLTVEATEKMIDCHHFIFLGSGYGRLDAAAVFQKGKRTRDLSVYASHLLNFTMATGVPEQPALPILQQQARYQIYR